MNIGLAQVVSLAVGTVLPLLAGLTVRIDAHPRVRSIVLLALAGLTSFLTELGAALNSHQAFNIGAALLSVLLTFLGGVATQVGLWEPTGVAAAAQAFRGFIGGSKTAGGSVAPTAATGPYVVSEPTTPASATGLTIVPAPPTSTPPPPMGHTVTYAPTGGPTEPATPPSGPAGASPPIPPA